MAKGYCLTNDDGTVTFAGATFTASVEFNSAALFGGDVQFDGAFLADDITLQGNITLATAGNGLYIKEGSNATMGVATLSGGTVTVATSKITANTRVFLTMNGAGTLANAGAIYEDTASRSAGVSFVIKSLNILSNSSVAWMLVEPA